MIMYRGKDTRDFQPLLVGDSEQADGLCTGKTAPLEAELRYA